MYITREVYTRTGSALAYDMRACTRVHLSIMRTVRHCLVIIQLSYLAPIHTSNIFLTNLARGMKFKYFSIKHILFNHLNMI